MELPEDKVFINTLNKFLDRYDQLREGRGKFRFVGELDFERKALLELLLPPKPITEPK